MSGLNVLIVGSGGREHALGWALERSDSVARVHAAPGNPGLSRVGMTWPVRADDADGIAALVQEQDYDLVVIGPEAPLAAGLADRLRAAGHTVFGPGADAARLESSKAYAKEFMARHDIPTADYHIVRSPGEAEKVLARRSRRWVIKASGLAAGKGVILADSEAEVRDALRVCFEERRFGEAGTTVVMEDWLEGPEVSVFAVTDGTTAHLLPVSQDHKRAFDGDEGPNTGGMGAYTPAAGWSPALAEALRDGIVEPTLAGLRRDGLDYRGLLYFGLMLTPHGPRLLEYNVRFGDPETQAVLPVWGGDLGALLLAAARGELAGHRLTPARHAAGACVVAAAPGYPASADTGAAITGIVDAERHGVTVFHAGTRLDDDGTLRTSGGRVLAVSAVAEDLRTAIARAYRGIESIGFEGMWYRTDIGQRADDTSSANPSH